MLQQSKIVHLIPHHTVDSFNPEKMVIFLVEEDISQYFDSRLYPRDREESIYR